MDQEKSPNYSRDIKIASYDVDQNNTLRVSCMMQYFQQIARENLDMFGLTYDFLRENDIVFVLSRYSIKQSAPLYADRTYTFRTSPSLIHGPYFIRDFAVTDENGNTLVMASTAWVIIHYSNRRLLRPNALPIQIPIGTRLCDYIPDKTDVRENGDYHYNVRVVNSLLDSNNHLNNCHYMDLLIDGLYENDLSVDYSEFHLNYVQEAHYDDELMIDYAVENNSVYVRVANHTQNSTCFTAVLLK